MIPINDRLITISLLMAISLALNSCGPQVAWPAESNSNVRIMQDYKTLGMKSPQPVFKEIPELVYMTIAMESASEYRKEGLRGLAMVARVIVNRANESNKRLEQVCWEPFQFSCWNMDEDTVEWRKRWLHKHYTPEMRQIASYALEMALYEMDQTYNHYHTVSSRPKWAKGRIGHRVGNHIFYTIRRR